MLPVKNGLPLLSTLPKLFDDFLSRDVSNWSNENFSTVGSTLPAVNVRETPDAYVVEMAAPGMNREDFRIELDGDLLTITGERKAEEQKENERYARTEFSYQSFQRSFRLSKKVLDEDQIVAKYENGLLNIYVPKKEEAKAKPPRTIQIS
jgi:HSP20 family protein